MQLVAEAILDNSLTFMALHYILVGARFCFVYLRTAISDKADSAIGFFLRCMQQKMPRC